MILPSHNFIARFIGLLFDNISLQFTALDDNIGVKADDGKNDRSKAYTYA